MKTFLEELAGIIWSRYHDRLDRICIVLPNKRGGLYLKKYLAREASKTIWAPRILSVESLISEQSGLRIADHFSLMLDLYEVHRSLKGDQADPFHEFIHWGSTLIKDFNDTDLYLSDAQQLYHYLDATRAITTWNPDGRPLSEFQKDYLSFFRSLLEYYEKFRQVLHSKQWAYPGMAFRKVAEQPEVHFQGGDKLFYIFAGFNALTPAEEKIIRYLITEGKADCIWDSDAYYLDDPRQEAGMFLRKYRDEWGNKDFTITGQGWADKKNITITGIAGYAGQAKACGDLLSSMNAEEIADTCVVLGDENLLLPVLNSIPSGISQFNITMGFPISMSPLETLIRDVLRMQENADRACRMYGWEEPQYYLNDLIRIIGHPYVNQWTGTSETHLGLSVSHAVTAAIRKEQRFLIPLSLLKKEIQSHSKTAWDKLILIFQPWNEASANILGHISHLLEGLSVFFGTEENAALEREFIYQYTLILQSLRQALSEHAIPIDLSTAGTILHQMTVSATIPFYGEPLSGLQLMGVLETRNLDFKNIIMLSVNDEIIPGGKMQQSFIPQDIRKEFSLPSYIEKEAVYAYHFYRLLQRGQTIHLLYNTEADPLGSGDKSRFVAQLQHELPAKNPAAVITERMLSLEPRLNLPSADIIIQKTPGIMELLKNKATKGFSPSSINRYLGCSLQFYFQDLLGLREEVEATESMDAATLGTTIHDTLNRIYQDHLRTELTSDLIGTIRSKALPVLREEFQKNLRGSDMRYGKNLLLHKVGESFLTAFLDHEKRQVEEHPKTRYVVEFCEEELQATFLCGENKSTTVLLKGRADRIDSLNGRIRIVDYKTGKVEKNELEKATMEDVIRGEKSEKSLQLLIYAYLFFTTHPEYQGSIESGIISFRNRSRGLMSLQIGKQNELTAQVLREFGQYLQQLFTEIFDPSIPFIQTEDQKKCKLCPYLELCYKVDSV